MNLDLIEKRLIDKVYAGDLLDVKFLVNSIWKEKEWHELTSSERENILKRFETIFVLGFTSDVISCLDWIEYADLLRVRSLRVNEIVNQRFEVILNEALKNNQSSLYIMEKLTNKDTSQCSIKMRKIIEMGIQITPENKEKFIKFNLFSEGDFIKEKDIEMKKKVKKLL